MSTQTPVSAILKLRDPMEQSSEIDHGTTAGSRTLSRENLPLSSKEEQEHPSMRPVMLGNTTSRSQQHVTKIPLHDDQDKSRPWKERRSLREKDYVRNSFTVESRFRRWRQQGVGERSKMGGGELPDQLHEVSEQARSEFRQTGDENANMGALAGLGSSCPWRTLNDEVHRLAIGGSGGPRETKVIDENREEHLSGMERCQMDSPDSAAEHVLLDQRTSINLSSPLSWSPSFGCMHETGSIKGGHRSGRDPLQCSGRTMFRTYTPLHAPSMHRSCAGARDLSPKRTYETIIGICNSDLDRDAAARKPLASDLGTLGQAQRIPAHRDIDGVRRHLAVSWPGFCLLACSEDNVLMVHLNPQRRPEEFVKDDSSEHKREHQSCFQIDRYGVLCGVSTGKINGSDALTNACQRHWRRVEHCDYGRCSGMLDELQRLGNAAEHIVRHLSSVEGPVRSGVEEEPFQDGTKDSQRTCFPSKGDGEATGKDVQSSFLSSSQCEVRRRMDRLMLLRRHADHILQTQLSTGEKAIPSESMLY